jgi:chorismate mutase
MSEDQLGRYRQSIDNIDAALVFMLAERFKITQAVGELKALARDANLDPEFSEKFLRFVIEEVIRHHERLREE